MSICQKKKKRFYFDSENLTFDKMDTKVTAWSGYSGVFPNYNQSRRTF